MTSKTYTLAEIRAERRATIERQRARVVKQDASRIERGWSLDDDFADIWRVLCIVSALILALVIALGIYSFAASSKKVVEASEVRAAISACKAEGGTAQVSRDLEGRILAVRCEP